MTAPTFAVRTFADMRSHNIFHGGVVHTCWCDRILCDGACTASAHWPTLDGRTLTLTVTLPHDALWLTFGCTVDGQPVRFDPHMVTVDVCDAIHRQVRAWNQSIPSPVYRATPAGGVR